MQDYTAAFTFGKKRFSRASSAVFLKDQVKMCPDT